jgi:hypothetical protein
MTISARSALMAGVATVTASAVLIAPSVEPLPPPKPEIQLAANANIKLTAQPADYFTQLGDWWQPIFWPSAGQPFPQPPTQPLPTPGSIPGSLEAAYHAIEPWVQYGFELAQYAVGWIPYVGWLSGQIMIFYQLGEGIVHAIVHNTLDWLDGNGSFAQNLGEGIRWSIDTLIQFGINEWNYFLPPLPPLPPIPCIVFCTNLSEFNAPLDGIRVGLRETVTDLLAGLSAIIPLPRDPEEPPVGLTTADVPGFTAKRPDLVSQVSRVPETVIDFLNPSVTAEDKNAGTVTDVPKEPKKPRRILTSLVEIPGNILKGAVHAQGEVRGVTADATPDDTQATVGRAHGPISDAVANTANTVTKRLTDTARDVASTVKKASDDTRASIKKATDDTRASVKKTKANGE